MEGCRDCSIAVIRLWRSTGQKFRRDNRRGAAPGGRLQEAQRPLRAPAHGLERATHGAGRVGQDGQDCQDGPEDGGRTAHPKRAAYHFPQLKGG